MFEPHMGWGVFFVCSKEGRDLDLFFFASIRMRVDWKKRRKTSFRFIFIAETHLNNFFGTTVLRFVHTRIGSYTSDE